MNGVTQPALAAIAPSSSSRGQTVPAVGKCGELQDKIGCHKVSRSPRADQYSGFPLLSSLSKLKCRGSLPINLVY